MGFSESMHYELMVKAAYYYYEKGLTQTVIAEKLGISRLTLGRILKEAKATGVVKIDIVDSRNLKTYLEYEDLLCKRFGLQSAVVAGCMTNTATEAEAGIAASAAGYISRNIRSGMKLSISWGKTLRLIMDRLPTDHSVKDIEVSTLIGGAGTTDISVQPEMLAGQLLSGYSGRGYVVNAPFFCQTEEVCRGIKAEPRVRDALARSLQSDLTFVGIGEPPNLSDSYWAHTCYDDATLREIIASGAVGDLCGTYINAEGVPCCRSVADRLVAIDIEDLKKHKCVVAAAGGPSKLPSITAALRGGYVDVLITDSFTAKELLGK